MKSIQSVLLLGLSLVFLTNCSLNRSQTGAMLGATTTTAGCVTMGVDNPYAIATCAVIGSFAGAEIMYKSDYGKEKDKDGDYGDYSGVNHDGMLNDKKE